MSNKPAKIKLKFNNMKTAEKPVQSLINFFINNSALYLFNNKETSKKASGQYPTDSDNPFLTVEASQPGLSGNNLKATLIRNAANNDAVIELFNNNVSLGYNNINIGDTGTAAYGQWPSIGEAQLTVETTFKGEKYLEEYGRSICANDLKVYLTKVNAGVAIIVAYQNITSTLASTGLEYSEAPEYVTAEELNAIDDLAPYVTFSGQIPYSEIPVFETFDDLIEITLANGTPALAMCAAPTEGLGFTAEAAHIGADGNKYKVTIKKGSAQNTIDVSVFYNNNLIGSDNFINEYNYVTASDFNGLTINDHPINDYIIFRGQLQMPTDIPEYDADEPLILQLAGGADGAAIITGQQLNVVELDNQCTVNDYMVFDGAIRYSDIPLANEEPIVFLLDGGLGEDVNAPIIDDVTKPLAFKATVDNSSVSLTKIGNVSDIYQVSNDGENWVDYTFNTSITVNNNQFIYFRAKADRLSNYNLNYRVTFLLSGKIKAYNNINSLLTPNFISLVNLKTIHGERAFEALFKGSSSLIKAPLLPATTLSSYCYKEMFMYCNALTDAPALPATTIEPYCYANMFEHCSSLKSIPVILPATELKYSCYYMMFKDCTSLNSTLQLPATELVPMCYSNMFAGCTNLTSAPNLPATTLAYSCYANMFVGCTNLISTPNLPATTLTDANMCYLSMFADCTSLTNVPILPATTLSNGCYTAMFMNCTSLTNAPALPATTLADSCYSSMFSGCTSLVSAPALPATILTKKCYDHMFYNCSLINEIHIDATDTSATDCLFTWLYGVAATGDFYCYDSSLYTIDSYSGIPTNWTIHSQVQPVPSGTKSSNTLNSVSPTYFNATAVNNGTSGNNLKVVMDYYNGAYEFITVKVYDGDVAVVDSSADVEADYSGDITISEIDFSEVEDLSNYVTITAGDFEYINENEFPIEIQLSGGTSTTQATGSYPNIENLEFKIESTKTGTSTNLLKAELWVSGYSESDNLYIRILDNNNVVCTGKYAMDACVDPEAIKCVINAASLNDIDYNTDAEGDECGTTAFNVAGSDYLTYSGKLNIFSISDNSNNPTVVTLSGGSGATKARAYYSTLGDSNEFLYVEAADTGSAGNYRVHMYVEVIGEADTGGDVGDDILHIDVYSNDTKVFEGSTLYNANILYEDYNYKYSDESLDYLNSIPGLNNYIVFTLCRIAGIPNWPADDNGIELQLFGGTDDD